jgi:hypothetical protein
LTPSPRAGAIVRFLAAGAFIATVVPANPRTVGRWLAYDRIVLEAPFRAALLGFDAACLAAAALLVVLSRPAAARWATRLLVSWTTVAAMVAALELSFPTLLRWLPLNLQAHVSWPFNLLCQSSKQRSLPHDYVALLGDSNAQGFGDWLVTVDPWKNPPYHSSHLVAERLHRDVLSFGRGGAGSIAGLVGQPVNGIRLLRRRFAVEDPGLFLVYFFEGNDLSDNVRELGARHYLTRYGSLDREAFFRFLETEVVHERVEEATAGTMLASRFLVKTAHDEYLRARGLERKHHPPRFRPQEAFNWATVGGIPVQLPARLEGPTLLLNADEIELAVRVFELSLEFLMRLFPDVPVVIAYLPSALTCYDVTGELAAPKMWGRPSIFRAEEVTPRSDDVAERIRRVAVGHGAAFVDSRARLREAARIECVHGPTDWLHFNRRGYEVLAATVAGAIDGRVLRASGNGG